MATVNYIPYQRQSAVSLGKVAGYVSQDEKTQDRRTGRKLVSGVRCSSHFAVQEFRATRTAHHKKSPVWFYHYTQSFSPKEPITGPQAHQLAKEFAEQAWPESQVLVATHVDARHIHSHFLVNAVCYESGKMLRQGPRTLEHLRDLSDQLCMKYHYSVLPRERPKQGKEPSTREYRSMEKGQSWKLHLMVAIEDCMALARSRRDFIRRMERRGYGVRWEDGRKYICYCQREIAEQHGRELNPYLFVNEKGNPIHPDTFTKHLRQIFEENDFPDTFHLHTLRHYFVSTMLHEGVDKQTVAELAGHGDTSFLERTYCHPQMALKEQAAEKMEQILLHSA